MKMDKNQLQAIVGLFLIVGLVGYGYWHFFYAPVSKEISTRQATINDLNSRIRNAENRAAQLPQMKKELALLDIEVARLEKQLPKKKEIPGLLRTMTSQSSTYGVSIQTISPGAPINKGVYDEVPYVLSSGGSFHSFIRFLTALGQNQRLFSARNISFTGVNGDQNSNKSVNTNFTLIAFKYHE